MKPFTTLPPFLSLAAGMCHHGTKLAARQEAVDYSYHNTQGALLWQTLTPEFEVCATGNNQSPIDLDGSIETVEGSQYQLKIDSYPRGIELENLGNTVQGSLNGSAIFGDEEYSLVQLHFHTPSEHHIDGEYYPAEVHFVFQNDESSLAVIGFMIDITAGDQTSPALSSILANIKDIPAGGDVTITKPLKFFDINKHIDESDVYTYDGSLTTPPCSEGVVFNVAAEPVLVHVDAFRALKKVIKFNSRFTQNAPGDSNLLELVIEDA